MSIEQTSLFPPSPSTTRGQSAKLSTSVDGAWLSYGSGKSAVLRPLREIDSKKDQKTVTLFGHAANVLVSTISPTGYYVASGDANGNLKVWSTIGDQTVKLESKPIARINDVAFDGEGKRIIAVGEGRQGFAATFNLDTGSSVGEVVGHSKVVNAVAMKQSRPFRAATASDDLTVCLHTGVPFKFHSQHRHHSRFAQSVAYTTAGDYFASAGSDGKVVLYGGTEGDKVAEASFEGTVFSVAFDKTGKHLATAGADGLVRLLDVPSLTQAKSWNIHSIAGGDALPNQQVGVAWATDDIVALSFSGTLHFLDPSADKPKRVIYGHQNAITALACGQGNELYSGDSTGLTRKWHASECAPVEGGSAGHSSLVIDIVPTGSKGSFASIGYDDTVRFIQDGKLTSRTVSTGSQPRGLAYSPSTSTLFVATVKSLMSLSAASGAAAADAPKTSSEPLKFEPTAIAVSPDGTKLAVSGDDLSLRLFDTSSLAPLGADAGAADRQVELLRTSKASRLAWSPDGKYLAVGDSTGKLHLYDADSSDSGQLALVHSRFSFQTARILSIAWTADSAHVASASLDESMRVYSLAKPSAVLTAKNVHRGGTNVVLWAEDANTLVSAGADGAIKHHRVTFK